MPREITPQGQARRSQYKAQEARAEQERTAQGPPEAFLRGLRMELRVWHAREQDLGRLVELMERTRQWNSTGLRLGEDDLRARLSDAAWWVCAASLQDRFGDDGLCALSLAQREQDAWVARLWAVSCRVQNRGVGPAFLGWLIEQARAQGLGFALELRRTERNRPLSILLRVSGFEGATTLAGVEVLRWPTSLAAPNAPWVRVLDEAP
jgi:methoxymalonate biosynthesis protein